MDLSRLRKVVLPSTASSPLDGSNLTISAANLNPEIVTAPSPGIDECSSFAAARTHIAEATPFHDPPTLTTGDATPSEAAALSNINIDIHSCLGGGHARGRSDQAC
jgi:hypothetical protein